MRTRVCLGMFFALVVCGACTSTDTDDGDEDRIDASATAPDATPGDIDATGGGGDDVDAASTCELGCVTVSGSWSVMMPDCDGSTICMIFQTGCAIQLSCTDSASYSGTICGNEISYAGDNADGRSQACTGTVSGSTMTGSCDIEGTACNFTSFQS